MGKHLLTNLRMVSLHAAKNIFGLSVWYWRDDKHSSTRGVRWELKGVSRPTYWIWCGSFPNRQHHASHCDTIYLLEEFVTSYLHEASRQSNSLQYWFSFVLFWSSWKRSFNKGQAQWNVIKHLHRIAPFVRLHFMTPWALFKKASSSIYQYSK